jgi:uncharacterized protein YacL
MRLTSLAIIGILLVATILTGCSSNQEKNTKMRPNLNEEQINEMMKERLEISQKSCEGKQEGDSCIIQGRIGELESICVYQNDLLLCQMNRPTRK